MTLIHLQTWLVRNSPIHFFSQGGGEIRLQKREHFAEPSPTLLPPGLCCGAPTLVRESTRIFGPITPLETTWEQGMIIIGKNGPIQAQKFCKVKKGRPVAFYLVAPALHSLIKIFLSPPPYLYQG
jgi:hypothetical protein